jgi:uroporphyrinogen-III synthase
MIKFSLIEQNLEFESYDLLMFTSKQAVKSADLLNPKWKDIPCIAIGSSTAQEIKRMGGSVIYQPESFYGESLGEDIIEKFSDKNILYLRPKVVSFDSKSFLAQAGIELHEKIIYETTCIKYPKESSPSQDAIIIFTSPSTIHCFLENFAWDDAYTAVVIGESTKVHLPSNVRYEVADTPRIDSCIAKAKEILITSNSK